MEGAKVTESVIANEMIELGRKMVAREVVLDAIGIRFPEALTPEVERAIADQSDLPLLREWHLAALRATTGEEFVNVLRR
jgi:hypothetical protein